MGSTSVGLLQLHQPSTWFVRLHFAAQLVSEFTAFMCIITACVTEVWIFSIRNWRALYSCALCPCMCVGCYFVWTHTFSQEVDHPTQDGTNCWSTIYSLHQKGGFWVRYWPLVSHKCSSTCSPWWGAWRQLSFDYCSSEKQSFSPLDQVVWPGWMGWTT